MERGRLKGLSSAAAAGGRSCERRPYGVKHKVLDTEAAHGARTVEEFLDSGRLAGRVERPGAVRTAVEEREENGLDRVWSKTLSKQRISFWLISSLGR